MNNKTLSLRRKWPLAVALTFACTVMGGLSHAAINVGDVPLKMAENVPPNIWFILDDSGSMTFTAMPGDRDDFDLGRGDTIAALGDSVSDRAYTLNTIYYNPNLTYSPWLDANGKPLTGGTDYGAVYTHPSLLAKDDDTTSWAGTNVGKGLPENLYERDQIFYVPEAGYTGTDSSKYSRFVIRAGTGTVERCSSSGWTCKPETPTGRSEADERKNFATWFSYHRTRMKAAKAGAMEAFSGLTKNYRVGYDTIHQRNTLRIPVTSSNGLFENTNRTTWFSRLTDASGKDGTPLLSALDRAGKYFSENGSDGPYGGTLSADNKQLQCRQNFTILTTDGYWNSDTMSVGNTDNEDGMDVKDLEGKVERTYSPKAPYMDSWSNTLADVAMKYWKTDLRTDMDNIVAKSTANPAFWQHMVTFGISIGLKGTLGLSSVADVKKQGTVNWPDPTDREDAERIDDLLHAAVNGHGEFVSASNPSMFAKALTDALATITYSAASRSNVSANSTALRAGTYVYQASYLGGAWTGELKAYPVVGKTVSRTPTWAAADKIKYSGRKVLTEGGTFPHSDAQIALGENITNYIKGDQSKEQKKPGGTLRNRASLLGDIVYSSPTFVEGNVPLVITEKDVDDTVYVGANDGMLHAFDAADGTERFAYVPGGLNLTKLAALASPDYLHHFFVDGPVVVSTREQTQTEKYPNGRNILVGTLGRGGKGMFALDVTDVTNPTVLWDNTWSDDVGTGSGVDKSGTSAWSPESKKRIGHITSAPFITRLADGTLAVIAGNGLHLADSKGAVTAGEVDEGALLVINLETGAMIKDIPLFGIANNSVSAPRGWDADGDKDVDYVYAGDLQGNVWKFDLTTDKSKWGASYGTLEKPEPMFKAIRDNKVQPITGGVTVAVDPLTFKRFILFGTGRFLTDTDPVDYSVQTLYALVDDGKQIAGRTKLTQRTKVVDKIIEGREVRAFGQEEALDLSKTQGWYRDLLDSDNTADGERIIGQPRNEAGNLIVASGIPSTSACDPDGTGFNYSIDAFTGGSPAKQYWDSNKDGRVDENDDDVDGNNAAGVGHDNMQTDSTTLQDDDGSGKVICGDYEAGMCEEGNDNAIASGRIAWRELMGN